MIYFNNDYSEGCHPKILEALARTNLEQTFGYGEDEYCARAAEKIRTLCGREDAAVHFLVGGTQTNLTVIAAALRPHQGVVCAGAAAISTPTRPVPWRQQATRCCRCRPRMERSMPGR